MIYDKNIILKTKYLKKGWHLVALTLASYGVLIAFLYNSDLIAIQKLLVAASYFVSFACYGMGFFDYWLETIYKRFVFYAILFIANLLVIPTILIFHNWLAQSFFFLANTSCVLTMYISPILDELENPQVTGISDTEEGSSDGPDVTGV